MRWRGVLVLGLALLAACASRPQTSTKATDPWADLTVQLRSTPLLRPGQDVKITWTVKNIGHAPAPESHMDIIVKNAHAPRQVAKTFKRKVRALGAGDEFSSTFSVRLSIGLYEICGTADRKKKVRDSDRKNNQDCILIEGK